MATIQENRRINFADLVFKSIIGKKIYQVVNRLTGKTYALKEFNHPYGPTEREKISREIEIAKALDHPNVVKCYEVFYIGDFIFLLLESIGCPLFEINITSESDITCLVHQALLGLRYLHQNKIWHGDIKPSNIFVNHMKKVKVLYFGKTLANKTAVEVEEIHDGWNVRLCSLALSRILIWCFGSEGDGGALHSFALACMMKRWTVEELLILTPFTKDLPTHTGLLKEKGELSAEDSPFCAAAAAASSSELISAITHEEGISSSRPHLGEEQISQDDLKRCIQHCALFLPDYEFDKEKMVMMWIAEDCIELQVSKRMEDIANSYFNALVEENIIVPSKFDGLYQRMKYKVNKSAASTWFIEPGKYIRVDAAAANFDEVQFEEALHLTWHCKTVDQTFFDALKNLKHLRTLVMRSNLKQFPRGIFLDLKLLRTLVLSHTNLSELPGSIEYLESVRCLDVSDNPITSLPESVDCLRLLQSLILRGCSRLSALPRGFGRLINLSHLDLNIIHQLKSMPRGMGNLIKLQTLPEFIVGKNDGCGIGELKFMNEITGSFCISQLENVSGIEEAEEASLCDKKHIDKLELKWGDDPVKGSQDKVEILECLQPHFQLKEFELSFYSGSKLPSWMSNPSFTDLASITLVKCINCDILPSLGVLPSLKILRIYFMHSLKRIDTLFCRNDTTKGFNAFPKLERLTIDDMEDLEEWTGIEDGDFPRLRRISIRCCGKLRALPSFTHFCSLKTLEIGSCAELISLPEGLLPSTLDFLIIKRCPKIKERCRKDEGLDWFKIALINTAWIDFEKFYFGESLD